MHAIALLDSELNPIKKVRSLTKELVCFKGLVELRSRPQVGVLPDIRMGSKVDQNPLATGY